MSVPTAIPLLSVGKHRNCASLHRETNSVQNLASFTAFIGQQ